MSKKIYDNKANLETILSLLQEKAVGTNTSDATATQEMILEGEIAYTKDGKVIGTMPNLGEINITFNGIDTDTITIDEGYTQGATIKLDSTIGDEVYDQTTLIDQLIEKANSLPNIDDNVGGEKPTLFTPSISFTESTSKLTITDNNGLFADGYDIYNAIDDVYVTTIPTKNETLSQYVNLTQTGEYKVKATSTLFNDSEFSPSFVWHYYQTTDGTPGLSYTIGSSSATCTGIGSSTEEEVVIATEVEGKKVTTIKDFNSLSGLKKITISGNIGNIGSSSGGMTLYGCNDLEEVVVEYPGSATIYASIYNCANLKHIYFNGTAFAYDSNALTSNPNLQGIHFKTMYDLLKFRQSPSSSGPWDKFKGTMTYYVNEKPITSIVVEGIPSISDTFTYYTKLQSIDTGSATTINNYAFKGCSNLKSIIIGDSITSIGQEAFYNCVSLQGDINIPSGVTVINSNTFAGCIGIKRVHLPNTITKIDTNAFKGCIDLEQINIPSSLRLVYKNVFDGCTKLDSRKTIENGLTYFGDVDNPYSLLIQIDPSTQIMQDLNSGVKCISTSFAYSISSKLTTVDLSSLTNLQSIGDYAFRSVKTITTLQFPQTQTFKYLGNYAFSGCGITSVEIPSSVESIGTYAFSSCSSLQQVLLQEGITTIPQYMLQSCTSLQQMIMPSTINKIDSYAFSGCSKLKRVDFSSHTSIPTLASSNAFNSTHATLQIKVPEDLYGTWRSTTNWSAYASKIVTEFTNTIDE